MSALCSKCGASVGCGCNLINGMCVGCYNQSLQQVVTQITTQQTTN